MNNSSRRRLVLLIIIVALLYFGTLYINQVSKNNIKFIPYSELVQTIESGNIKKVMISSDGVVNGEYKRSVGDKTRFQSEINSNDENELNKLLLALNPRPEIIKDSRQESPLWNFLWIIMVILPIIIMIRFVILLSQGGRPQGFSGSGNIADFISRTKEKNTGEKPETRFKDVAGIDEVKEELTDVVDFLANPNKYTSLGGRIPKGVLLVGPPGVGKTLLAKAVAGEANVAFLSASGSEFVEVFVGVGASRIRDLFEKARRAAPCIIFIDEIDSLGSRSAGIASGGTKEHDQTLNQILTEMDGFESSKGIILIAATNREDKLDTALLRPGRFDRKVYVNLPDIKGREQILEIHTHNVILDNLVDLKILARLTPGFSGADLANLVNEAALAAAKDGKEAVALYDFELAKDKILLGKENKSLSSVMTEEEKRITAVHEAGHAIVALTMPENDPLHKVSIIPRGRALGITSQLPETDRYSYSEEYLFENLCILFGGRVAEEIFFSKVTAGAQNDIEKATKLAETMVCELGMSPLGLRNFSQKPDPNGHYYTLSEDMQEKIDMEINRLLKKAHGEAKKVLIANTNKLNKISEALIEKETLDREEIEKLFKEP